MKTYGRKTIYVNYTEEELLTDNVEELQRIVIDIIQNSKSIHDFNRRETLYLKDYYKGIQDIYVEKQKTTRPEINNKTVENWAYAMVDFKKSWLLGKPIQYSLFGSESNEEITTLNKYCSNNNKEALDQMLFEDVLVCGRAFRFVKSINDEEMPFKLINIDPEDCEVVYSSSIGHEQLLSYIETSKKYVDTTNPKKKKKYYSEFTVYLKNKTMTVTNQYGEYRVIDIKPNIINEHKITEYYLNKNRISLIELGKDLFNDINYLESLDKDDMEQFANAIMVFVNVEVSEEEIEDIRKIGAVSISSTNDKEAKIELLEQRLNANTTNMYYSRLINALHQILGIPKSGDSGDVSYGDTGQARLTGQGYTSAGIRADSDETMFEMCDKNSLKTILKICREKTNSLIKTLRTIDVKANFQRNMSDNLLVKSQAIQTLYNAHIPREIANTIVGLFPDPNVVTKLQQDIFGDEANIVANAKTNINQTTNENNKLREINQKAIQAK